MAEERRSAARSRISQEVSADVGGVAVRIVELSLAGARIEHEERFPLVGPQMAIRWKGMAVSVALRVVRSEIAGRKESSLIYQTGVRFIDMDSVAQRVIASILRDDTSAAPPAARPPAAVTAPSPQAPSLDDTWVRQVRLLRDELDDHLRDAQFRLTEGGWRKEYVATPEQPPDGFTIPRDQLGFDQLQRSFEAADPDTRRMMQIALESQLTAKSSAD
jgi:hypothetical protein